jgi:hypothetical protein
MSRRRQRIVLLLAALGLLVSALLIYGGGDPQTTAGGEPAAGAVPAPAARAPSSEAQATGAAAGPDQKVDRLHTFKRGARTAVPKLAAAVASPPAFDAGATRHPRRLDRGSGDGPVDKRPGPPRKDAEALKKALFQRLDKALDAAQACLDSWSEQDDSLDAGVMLAFSLDDRGLQQVWIQDRQGVPAGPLACIANAVYPIDWGGLTTEPVEVTVPVKYEPRDAG